MTAFFDSLLRGTRRAALNWRQQDECPAQDDPVLWCRLTESPYEDIRLKLVHFLQTKADATGLSTDDMTPVWSSVLLGVHRGGRTKLAAVKQLANAINKKPKAANSLLPVLAIAVRSIRRPEFRAGLAAIVQLVENNEVMAETVVRLLPELQLTAGASQ